LGRISATIPDELEKKLRLKALEVFGGKRVTYPGQSKNQ
jgi:hypothetical protein